MGKSRLVAEFVRSAARARRRRRRSASASRSAPNTSYFVWREIWRRCSASTTASPSEEQIAALEARLAAIDPTLAAARAAARRRCSASRSPTPSSPRRSIAKLRKTSLEDLLASACAARATDEPLVLVLEDCHWIDPLSRDLLEVLARALAELPVLLRARLPPEPEPGGGLGLEHAAAVLARSRSTELDAGGRRAR